ncbi:MAG: hypothetical protein IT324_05710 [Anaerolineae bacterium]|nr:hypothetical protein [Anaerolineae bacterium]
MKLILKLVALIVLTLSLMLTRDNVTRVQGQSAKAVGIAPVGRNAFTFVSMADQDGANLGAYGYLTHLAGLPDAALFTTYEPLAVSETAARFTFRATGVLTQRAEIQNIIDTHFPMTLTIYFNPVGGSKFADPTSFDEGVVVATYALNYQHVLNVYAPDTGNVLGSGESVQNTSETFTLEGQSYQFGRIGLVERFLSFGSGKRTEATRPKSQFILAGSAMVTGGVEP